MASQQREDGDRQIFHARPEPLHFRVQISVRLQRGPLKIVSCLCHAMWFIWWVGPTCGLSVVPSGSLICVNLYQRRLCKENGGGGPEAPILPWRQVLRRGDRVAYKDLVVVIQVEV